MIVARFIDMSGDPEMQKLGKKMERRVKLAKLKKKLNDAAPYLIGAGIVFSTIAFTVASKNLIERKQRNFERESAQMLREMFEVLPEGVMKNIVRYHDEVVISKMTEAAEVLMDLLNSVGENESKMVTRRLGKLVIENMPEV